MDNLYMKTPTKVTLDKYGLTEDLWIEMLQEQGGVCYICQKMPSKKRFVIDHQHVPNYKKLSPEKKRAYIRAILCWWCNKSYMGKGITLEKAQNMITLLKEYEERKSKLLAQDLK